MLAAQEGAECHPCLTKKPLKKKPSNIEDIPLPDEELNDEQKKEEGDMDERFKMLMHKAKLASCQRKSILGPCKNKEVAGTKFCSEHQEARPEESGEAPSMEADVVALVSAVRKVLDEAGVSTPALMALHRASEQMEPWLEGEGSPSEMGWVDSQGRP